MRRMTWMLALAGLLLTTGVATAQTETWGHCNPEGTWFGHNSEGLDLIATVDRVGFRTYSMIFDQGAALHGPPVIQGTDFRGVLKKAGRDTWTWRTFAYLALDVTDPLSFGFPYLLVDCPGQVEWDGCDAWHSDDMMCELKAFFHGQDPFVDGIPFGFGEPLSVSYKRMPGS